MSAARLAAPMAVPHIPDRSRMAETRRGSVHEGGLPELRYLRVEASRRG